MLKQVQHDVRLLFLFGAGEFEAGDLAEFGEGDGGDGFDVFFYFFLEVEEAGFICIEGGGALGKGIEVWLLGGGYGLVCCIE